MTKVAAAVVGGTRRREQRFAINVLNAEQIDDANLDTVVLQLIVSFQWVEQRGLMLARVWRKVGRPVVTLAAEPSDEYRH
ncbi:MAG TPA: hypothetical protein VEN79_09285 [Terriglobia bacterium]|nr:hypothetical protein [Terriglobia bacterium]